MSVDDDLRLACLDLAGVDVSLLEGTEEQLYGRCQVAVGPSEEDWKPKLMEDHQCSRAGVIGCIVQ